MTILSLPTISRTAPSSAVFSLISNTQAFESPLTESTQTTELPGARWQATFGWQNLTSADARILKAWLLQLSGQAGRFYLYDFTHERPSGIAPEGGLVRWANQTGRTISTYGWSTNQTGLFLPGDYVGIGGELKCVTQVASSDSYGVASLTFEPPLRTSPALNAPIVTVRPTCIMKLVDDKQDRFEYQEKNVTSLTVSCVEVF